MYIYIYIYIHILCISCYRLCSCSSLFSVDISKYNRTDLQMDTRVRVCTRVTVCVRACNIILARAPRCVSPILHRYNVYGSNRVCVL